MHNRLKANVNNLFWGTLLILLGLCFLGVNLGYIDSKVWGTLLDLWPILLIVWGINILVKNTPLWPIAYLTPIILVAGFGYAVFYPGNGGWLSRHVFIDDNRIEKRAFSEESYSYSFDSVEAESIALELTVASASLKVGHLEGQDAVIVDVKSDRGEPSVRAETSDAELSVYARTSRLEEGLLRPKESWRIGLPVGKKVELSFEGAANTSEIDLREMDVSEVGISAAVSKLDIWLPEPIEESTDVRIESAITSFRLHVPGNAQVKITSESALSVVESDGIELKKEGQNWYTEGFNRELPYIGVRLESALSSLSVIAWERSDTED